VGQVLGHPDHLPNVYKELEIERNASQV